MVMKINGCRELAQVRLRDIPKRQEVMNMEWSNIFNDGYVQVILWTGFTHGI